MDEKLKDNLSHIRSTMIALDNRLFGIAIRGKLSANVKQEMLLRIDDLHSKVSEMEAN